MDRSFLDANVLFSAAYKPESRLWSLCELPETELISSDYAIEEARRNLALARPHRLADLDRFLAYVHAVPEADPTLPDGVSLVDKDRPILAAAILAHASIF